MEYGMGAAQSIVSRDLWVKLGSSRLEPAGQLTAYGDKALNVMGQCWRQEEKPVEVELWQLEAVGIIEEVNPATTVIVLATPTVSVDKGNGMVQISGDF
ncbi:hypothetical protein J437_LFUL017275 [Ladona fulva]|uniref:Uncharacterized protein n=1 Tax=Ladona fulva TaxID=123851 RepID=A0A8K0P8U9_LADFU|nr:hypothetical protein J437_LFUL017275 [Ladona fulva]